MRIYDLACQIIELSGLTLKSKFDPDGDIEIIVTGLRPGEKLYEELLIGNDPKPTQHARIMKAHEELIPWPELKEKMEALHVAMRVNDVPLIRGLLKDLVIGYQPDGDVVDWVWIKNQRSK